jgi:hypothetical protein
MDKSVSGFLSDPQDMSETLDGFSAGCVVRCSTASFRRSDMKDSRSLTVKKL